LTQEQLARSEFPLGELTKEEVRGAARRAKLPVADKPESMELCFVPNGNYVQFIEAYSREKGKPLTDGAGEIVDEAGVVVGRHSGVHHFTIGQRKGLGFAAGRPLYVLAIDPEKNRVMVGDDESLRRVSCEVEGINWVALANPTEAVRALVKIRHKHIPAAATVQPIDETHGRVTFVKPQRAITSGQGAVFYDVDGDRVLGGGWIR
jgi:tRNA-uridine 2-sulfurtransferase